MYILTKEEGNLESGTYASVDDEGTPIVQFFESKDDAIMYNTMLEAIDQDVKVTEIQTELLEKLTGALGHAYTVVNEGEMVIPRMETLQHTMTQFDPFHDLFS